MAYPVVQQPMFKFRYIFLLIAIGVWLLVVLALLGRFPGGGDDDDSDTDTAQVTNVPKFELQCPDCNAIRVTRIIDGDTFVSGDTRVRLCGMDTPERGERCFSEATQRLRELAGGTVRVEPGPRVKDIYDRSLFYLYTESAASIHEALVREGWPVAWTRDGQHRDHLMDLERAARNEGVGCLW